MSTPAPYEIYAIKYAHHPRRASENFLGGDPHDGPMPLDYFVWAIVGTDKTWVLDTGFSSAVAKKRGREHLRSPGEGLKAIGVNPDRIEDVIVSHMHYDHVGNNDLFPTARYHVQDKEMQYVTGRCMCHPPLRHSFECEDVQAMVGRLFDGRLCFHDGAEELAPGLSVHFIGGHTMGLQSVRVFTRRGWVMLASDAAHLYANIEQVRPYPIIYNLGEMLEGYQTLKRLASSPAHIVPGHDPLVLKRYPAAKPGLEGVAVRLDVEPRG